VILWVAIGAAAVGLLVGLWLRSLFISFEKFAAKREESNENLDAMRRGMIDQAASVLNNPLVSREDRERVIRLMREHGLEFPQEDLDTGNQ